MLDQLTEGESLQQCHDVGEAFMEGADVGIGVLHVAAVDGVEDRVRHFMRDDVRTQAGEDGAARQVGTLKLVGRGEIPEQDRALVGVVIRIGLAQRVRMKAQARDVLALAWSTVGAATGLARADDAW